MSGKRILFVEDEAGLVLTVGDRLLAEGYELSVANDGEQGYEQALAGRQDLILLDLMLPKQSGFDVCRDLRQKGIETPILMLTARDQLIDKVLGLKLGADDYLTKPFETAELLARIEALLRRSASTLRRHGECYRFGELEVDLKRSVVSRSGDPVQLSAKEFALLVYFVENPDTTLSRHELLDRVWGYDAEVSTRTVDVHIAGLRRKLEPSPHHPTYILTVHGMGYRFVTE